MPDKARLDSDDNATIATDKDKFDIEDRGEIASSKKGDLAMYFINRLRN